MSEIEDKHAALGGAHGFLGQPASSETATPDGGGRFRHYVGGSVYWSAETGAHELHGAMREKYAELGWEQGPLGYPTTDESMTPDGVGRFNHFQAGSIYWTPVTGAHECRGAIRELWANDGWEQGPVGFPVTDEMGSTDGWRWQGFQRGAVRWNQTEGARRGSPPRALWGLADLHAHPMAHLGFGGQFVWGRPTGALQESMPHCEPSHGVAGTGFDLFKLLNLSVGVLEGSDTF